MKVTVTTAVALSKAKATDLTKKITKEYGSDAQIEFKVKPEIVAGIRITAGSKQLDGSIQHKLDLIKDELQSQL